MRILREVTDLPPADRGAVVALGNFDGVHRGHQAVIARARAIATAAGAPLAAMTFEPHPRQVFRPHDPPFRLTLLPAKARLIEALGVELLFVLRFDLSFSRWPAELFARRILAEALAARHVVVGHDFLFGHQRRGNPALLERLSGELGFGVTALAPVGESGGLVYSSTAVRQALRAGQPRRAAELLGRYWEIEGAVVAGERRGRQLGFPTANLPLGEHLVPALGVYAVRLGLEEAGGWRWQAGVANLGRRPTFGGEEVLLEAHLFDFAGELYGRDVRVQLIDFLRPERKFAGLEELKAQIARDAEAARASLAAAGRAT